MNFNAGPSHRSSSYSTSSSEDELDLIPYIEAHLKTLETQQSALLTLYANNNLLMVEYMNHQDNQRRHGDSVPGHRVINHGRAEAERNLWNDYFTENPRYPESMFRRRFRMSKSLFLRIVNAIEARDNYFVQKKDAWDKLGLSSFQKITAVFQILCYGVPADATDEYVKIGESTTIESTKRFCRAIVKIFGERYLRALNADDVARLLEIEEKRGFSRMLGSLDCMHWVWKNCPTACAGQYSGRSGSLTIILESVADYDLWICHAYFGLPGSNNDINVLEASHLFANLTQGIAPPAHYVIQGKEYHMGYYLANGIYPKWSTLVQTIQDPRGPKKNYFP